MENIRKHRNIKLETTEEKYLHTVMKPNFKSGVLFGENLMGCEMGKIKVVMNKPVYLGQAILDLSKIMMYEFHYDYMVPKYGLEKLKLCYMDTDSLVYDIKTEDFYEDIAYDALERICDFQFMYIIWFLVVYLTYFMKPVKETTFSSKIHKAFFANIRNDCVFSVIKNKQHSYAIRVWALSS